MSIASRIESISNHLENAYDSLENIGIDLTGINKNISNLSTQIESVYVDLPKTTETDTDITLNNIKKGKIKLILKGNINQPTTTGINQIGLTNLNSTTNNDITYSISNGELNINGTASSKTNIQALNYNLTSAATKSFKIFINSGTFSSGSIGLSFRDSNNSQISFMQINSGSKTETKQIDITGLSSIYLYVTAGTTFTNAKINCSLNDSSSATYEPYTGGIASPNPNYPQEIETVSGNNTIKIKGKNLLPFNVSSQTVNDITFTVNTDNSITMNGTASQKTTLYIAETSPLNGINGTITISSGLNDTSGVRLGMYINGEYYNTNSSRTQTFNPITSSGRPYVQIDSGVAVNNLTLKPMVEYGSSPTEYEPYQSQTYPINLGNLELCKIENYQDYFYKNTIDATDYSSERTLNAWYLKKNINKITFNGTENWDTQNSVFVLNVSDTLVQSYAGRSQIMLSDRFKGAITNYRGSLSNLCISKTIDNAKPHQIAIRYDDIISGGASSFKTWLSTHNTTAYYVLETPIFTEITGTLVTQLEALENAKSYKNQTNISQTNDNIPFIITASALSQNNS